MEGGRWADSLVCSSMDALVDYNGVGALNRIQSCLQSCRQAWHVMRWVLHALLLCSSCSRHVRSRLLTHVCPAS
jgi:hypothetical protein